MTQSTGIVRYGQFTDEALDQQASQASALSGGVWKFDAGENVVRFLPPPLGKNTPFRVSAMHFIDAVPGLANKTIAFACPRVELKEPCEACAKSEEMARSSNPVDRERGKKYACGLRVYANVLDRTTGEIRVCSFGKQLFDQLKAIRKNARLGGDFTDPTERGFDIIVMKEGSDLSTKYTAAAARESSPLAADAGKMQELIDMQHDLEGYVEPVVPEELLAIWQVTTVRAPYRGQTSAPAERPGASVMRNRGQSATPMRTVIETQGSAVGGAINDADFDDDFNPVKR